MMEVKPLAPNSVTFKGNQMIVSGPDMAQAQAIAKQLSSGSARLATYNGKQVLISTTSSSATAATPATPTVTTAGGGNSGSPATPVLPTQPLPPSAVNNVSSASTPPPPTPPPPPVKPIQVTAQLLQTAQGPRIVLQGIQGNNLPKEDLAQIQQQVKNQLLKAQAEAKQQGKVPPTKIVIDLPPAIQAKLQQQQTKESPSKTPTTAATVPAGIQLPTTPVAKPVVIQQQQSGGGPKMVVMNQQGATKVIGVAQSPAQQQASLLLQSLTPQKPVAGAPGTPNADGKFEVTPDYIQTAINSALKNTNLSPEIEQKLLALQQHNNTKSPPELGGGDDAGQPGAKKAKVNPGDEEWSPGKETGLTPVTTARTVTRRKRPTPNATGDSPLSNALTSLSSPPRDSESPAAAATILNTVAVSSPVASPPTAAAPEASEEKKKEQLLHKLDSMLLRQKEQLKRDIGKKRALQERELQEDIRRDIDEIKAAAAKVAEENESLIVQDGDEETIEEVTAATAAPVEENNFEGNETEVVDVTSPPIPEQTMASPTSTRLANSKRKRHESGESSSSGGGKRAVANNDSGDSPDAADAEASAQPPPAKKKKRNSTSSSSAVAAGIIKKDKVYCVCKTKYDPTK